MNGSEQPDDPVLQLDSLTLTMTSNPLVNNLSFRIDAGERVCLIGASGSGKSLTARAIIGTLPDGCRVRGSLRVYGRDVTNKRALSRPAASRVAAIFQDSATALNPLMPVGKQLTLAGFPTDPLAQADRLNEVGLDVPDLLARFPAGLSGGQRQRLCLLLALNSQSRLLIADEPTTALDVLSQHQVLNALQARCARPDAPALLFITHDIALAAQLCQRGLVMENGELIETGSMEALLNAPQQPYTRSLVAAAWRASSVLNREVT